MQNSPKGPPEWLKPAARSFLFLAVGLLLLIWLSNTPSGLLGKADAVGYAVCHRIDLRSFHLGERPLPLCARCTGMYLSAALVLIYQGWRWPRRGGTPPRPVLIACGLLALTWALDGVNSFLSFFPAAPTLYTPRNELRLLTGSGMGMAVGIVLYMAFNQTVWRGWDSRPAVGSLRSLAGLGLLVFALDVGVMLEWPILLYPLALLSAAGVLALLTMIYALIWIMIFRRENRYLGVSQMITPLVAGFGAAVLQIALSDALRFLVTGTWEGFHLG